MVCKGSGKLAIIAALQVSLSRDGTHLQARDLQVQVWRQLKFRASAKLCVTLCNGRGAEGYMPDVYNKNKIHIGLDGRQLTTVYTTTNQKQVAVAD